MCGHPSKILLDSLCEDKPLRETVLLEEKKILLEKTLKYPNLKMKFVKLHRAVSLQTA